MTSETKKVGLNAPPTFLVTRGFPCMRLIPGIISRNLNYELAKTIDKVYLVKENEVKKKTRSCVFFHRKSRKEDSPYQYVSSRNFYKKEVITQ